MRTTRCQLVLPHWPSLRALRRPTTIFVSNEKDNTVTVLDSETLKTIKTIPTGKRPRGIVHHAGLQGSDGLLGDDDRSTSSTPRRSKLYACTPGRTRNCSTSIPRASASTSPTRTTATSRARACQRQSAGRNPGRRRAGRHGGQPRRQIVVATSEADEHGAHHRRQHVQVLANMLVDTRPRVARIHEDGRHVWVSAEIGGTVAVIDAATYKITKKLDFEIPGVRAELIQPMGIRFSKDGKQAFVAIGRANRIAVSIRRPTRRRTTSSSASVPGTWRCAGRHEALCRQRTHQRHDRHRRCHLEGRKVRAGRPAALGHCRQAVRID